MAAYLPPEPRKLFSARPRHVRHPGAFSRADGTVIKQKIERHWPVLDCIFFVFSNQLFGNLAPGRPPYRLGSPCRASAGRDGTSSDFRQIPLTKPQIYMIKTITLSFRFLFLSDGNSSTKRVGVAHAPRTTLTPPSSTRRLHDPRALGGSRYGQCS